MTWFRTAAIAACLLSLFQPRGASGQVIDLRDCALDTITFVSNWGGGSFSTRRVAIDQNYYCAKSGWVEESVAAETCNGPYGTTTLLGELKRNRESEPELALAIYHVMWALPCCGWEVRRATAEQILETNWLDPPDVPLLRDDLSLINIDSIKRGPRGARAVDSMYEVDMSAMMCTRPGGVRLPKARPSSPTDAPIDGDTFAFGNPSGCRAHKGDWEHVNDGMQLVTRDSVRAWEQLCKLSEPNFEGNPMEVRCSGEGERWSKILSLFVNPAQPDALIYQEYERSPQGERRRIRMVELARCD